MLSNRSFFELIMVPQYIKNKHKVFLSLSHILKIPVEDFYKIEKRNHGQAKFLPIILYRNLSLNEVAKIKNINIYLPGIEIRAVPRRNYNSQNAPHIIGYLGEITSKEIKQLNKNKEKIKSKYNIGDLVGKFGLEKRWEPSLRGHNGYQVIQVDAFGRQTQSIEHLDWNLPQKKSEPGSDLILTLDLRLQKHVEQYFQGKYGAVIAMNPQNGEVLAIYSSPSYDLVSTRKNFLIESGKDYNDPYKPLFDKTTGGSYPPGSLYKPVVALAALQEGLISKNTRYNCEGSFQIGKDTFHCHKRSGHGLANLKEAVSQSCDVFFYNLGLELGIDKIAKYAQAFGLGSKLDFNVNYEDSGLIPTQDWKKRKFKTGWNIGDVAPISIGQGANLLTPLQIASYFPQLLMEEKFGNRS